MDPTLPANEKAREFLDNAWENQEIMKRVHIGKLLIFVLLLVAIATIGSLEILKSFGVDDRWTFAPGQTLWFVAYFYFLPRLLRRGWFQWLLLKQTDPVE